MSTKQIWTIKGKNYTHAQLMQLKEKGIDPRKGNVVVNLEEEKASKPKKEEEVKEEKQPEEVKQVEETSDEEVVEAEKKTEEVSIDLNALHKAYEEKHQKPVPNRYKNDLDWINKKLN